MAVRTVWARFGCLLLGLFIPCLAAICFGDDNPDAKVAVHVIPHSDARTCSTGIQTLYDINYLYIDCDAVDVFPVFYDIREYLGFEYGLTWPGPATCTFTSCSDLAIGDIVESGDGISQVWFGCQVPYGCKVPGFGRIECTELGRICVVPHPIFSRILVLDCHETVDEPMFSCCAGVCGEAGDNPWSYLGTLWITKSEDACPDCVSHGDTLSYTLAYSNTHWIPVGPVSVVDCLAPETEYVSSTPQGTYDAGEHTVTWCIGEMDGYEEGEVTLRARLKADAPASGEVVNTCRIYLGVTPIDVAWDTTGICSSPTIPTTWGKIKSLFR
jgi:uncharacterized repeat protein (TIGR01451 family)